MMRAAVVVALAILIVVMASITAHADPITGPIDAVAITPATRLDLELLEQEPELVAPPGSHCPDLYAIAVEHWPGAVLHWPVLDRIFYRESRCRPGVVNRYGCVGLMQICRVNHARLGVTRTDLQDAGTNIAIGYQLCRESMTRGRSCWRPWWLGRWRP
jgi:hypothetical protein